MRNDKRKQALQRPHPPRASVSKDAWCHERSGTTHTARAPEPEHSRCGCVCTLSRAHSAATSCSFAMLSTEGVEALRFTHSSGEAAGQHDRKFATTRGAKRLRAHRGCPAGRRRA